MKIRNKDRKYDISDIIIKKTDYGTEILMIINNKVHKIYHNSTYIDSVFNKILEYLNNFNDYMEVMYDRN